MHVVRYSFIMQRSDFTPESRPGSTVFEITATDPVRDTVHAFCVKEKILFAVMLSLTG